MLFRKSIMERLFLSTPSARRATNHRQGIAEYRKISIHALREEGDMNEWDYADGWVLFLSTPSARRATHGARPDHGRRPISIHALREEGDVAAVRGRAEAADFYPRPPRGGRQRQRRRCPRHP